MRGKKGRESGKRKSGRVILNTRELTEQIHLPTLFFIQPISLLFLLHLPSSLPFFSLYHLFLLSPPTSLISSKSSYIFRSVHLPPLPHCLPLLSPKKIRLTLMNRWREEGSDSIQGAQERLDQRFLDQCLFTQDSRMWSCQRFFLLPCFYSEGKTIKH